MPDGSDRRAAAAAEAASGGMLCGLGKGVPRRPRDEADGNPWPGIVGPCYTTSTLALYLSVPLRQVEQDADDLRLLRLITSDGSSLFPAFQVDNGQIIPGLRDVLRTLHDGMDSPLAWAMWLNVKAVRRGDGERPVSRIDQLRAGAIEDVLRAAQQTRWAWRS